MVGQSGTDDPPYGPALGDKDVKEEIQKDLTALSDQSVNVVEKERSQLEVKLAPLHSSGENTNREKESPSDLQYKNSPEHSFGNACWHAISPDPELLDGIATSKYGDEDVNRDAMEKCCILTSDKVNESKSDVKANMTQASRGQRLDSGTGGAIPKRPNWFAPTNLRTCGDNHDPDPESRCQELQVSGKKTWKQDKYKNSAQPENMKWKRPAVTDNPGDSSMPSEKSNQIFEGHFESRSHREEDCLDSGNQGQVTPRKSLDQPATPDSKKVARDVKNTNRSQNLTLKRNEKSGRSLTPPVSSTAGGDRGKNCFHSSDMMSGKSEDSQMNLSTETLTGDSQRLNVPEKKKRVRGPRRRKRGPRYDQPDEQQQQQGIRGQTSVTGPDGPRSQDHPSKPTASVKACNDDHKNGTKQDRKTQPPAPKRVLQTNKGYSKPEMIISGVVLQIMYKFASTEEAKETIRQHAYVPENVQLQIVEESIVRVQSRCHCEIVVHAKQLQLAKQFVLKLCHSMSDSLSAEVKHAFLLPTTARNEGERGVQDVDQRQRGDSSRANSSVKKSAVSSDPITKPEKIRDNKCKFKQQGRDSGSVSARVTVTVKQEFSRNDDLFTFLKRVIGDNLWHEVRDKSCQKLSPQAQCQITTNSKTSATKIAKKLTSSKLDKMAISCVVSENTRRGNSDETLCRVESERENTSREIHSKMASILITMLMKIHNLQGCIRHTKKIRRKDESEQRKLQEQKQELANLQKLRKGFFMGCNTLKEKVRKLDPKLTSVKELSEVHRSFEAECRRARAALPIYFMRDEIVKHVTENQVSIILGETGSGKSTQIVQYLYEAGLAGDKLIACTQPRKVAAMMIAERVAQEMGGKTGGLVGHRSGVDTKISKLTKIVFSTDYNLMRECANDPALSKYSCIVVDEVHERCIYTDVLLSMLKSCLSNRPDLKVIITSATVDPALFVGYFQCNPALQVPGNTYPVNINYEKAKMFDILKDTETAAVLKAVNVHKNEGAGDILVFVTSPVEIMHCIEKFEHQMKELRDFKCFPLHGQLSSDVQRQVFDPLPKGIRKVVFATNCAETSMTIDGIKYVIDTGVAKEVRYDPKTNITSLCKCMISKSSANQRKGRAGRTSEGKCYRLYTEDDYKSMQAFTQPEILRVHLGQAVLKLAELGVDVNTYDFVQSPSADAIDAAIKTLLELGALNSEGITDSGRFIAKLPFDPRQGYLVYKGSKKNLLYDSVVVASLISNGSNLFYRGLTQPEEQTTARNKNLFGSSCGDVMTWLDVFKTWTQLPKQQQSEWCRGNCINYKVMSSVKKCIKDVAAVLDKELGLEMKLKFSPEETTKRLLQRLIFEAHKSSLCCFLGHSKAGYFAFAIDQSVHIHPSSSLVAQNVKPEWIVYTELTKTSRDFVKCITVVEEAWLLEAIHRGQMNFELDKVKERKLKLVHREEAGKSVFREFKVPELEHSFSQAGMSDVIVETNRELGTLNIYSSSDMIPECSDEIRMIKEPVYERLAGAEYESKNCKDNDERHGGFNVVLQQGGTVKSILRPGQSDTILITQSDSTFSEEEILDKFEKFGEIVKIERFHGRGSRWGIIKYSCASEAETAVINTKHDEENAAQLKVNTRRHPGQKTFEARLSWVRRPVKGLGNAFITCHPEDRELLIGENIELSGRKYRIGLSRNPDNPNLVCAGIGEKEEDAVVRALLEILPHLADDIKGLVKIPREHVPIPDDYEIMRLKRDLCTQIEEFLPSSEFELIFNSPRETSLCQVAFIRFSNPLRGLRACMEMTGELRMGSYIVKINPKMKTRIYTSDKVKKISEQKLDEIKNKFKEKVSFNIGQARHRGFMIDIESSEAQPLVEVRDAVTSLLNGTIVDCKQNHFMKRLLKPGGWKTVKELEKRFQVLIIPDDRREELRLYGSEENVTMVTETIQHFGEGRQVDVCLRGSGKPPGLMKKLMAKYGALDNDFCEAFGLDDVIIDFKRHTLSLRGSPENVDKAAASISELESILVQSQTNDPGKWAPHCAVCLDVIEITSDLHRLEGCGHAYCMSCLKIQITVSIRNKLFPIACVHENCETDMVWQDLHLFVQKEWIREDELVSMSLNAYVACNQNKYRFCITQGCSGVYEVTQDDEGCEFTCPLCSMSICTSCHTAYHGGLTCKLLTSQGELEKRLDRWIKKKPRERKRCPGCKGPVEKTEGCNKMRCLYCKTVFCWECGEKFADSQMCYAHLMKIHGAMY